MDAGMVARIRANPQFVELERKRGGLAWTLTILMLAIYYGFVFTVAFAPSVIGLPVSGSITFGFLLGLGVIVSAVILTGIYVFRANGEFDRLTRDVVATAVTAPTGYGAPLPTMRAAGPAR